MKKNDREKFFMKTEGQNYATDTYLFTENSELEWKVATYTATRRTQVLKEVFNIHNYTTKHMHVWYISKIYIDLDRLGC